ncbi:MAG: phosphohydrolase [Acidimicrobiia bacterium]|nr:phosphohydrolase [Acidimicrobiia bacterium]
MSNTATHPKDAASPTDTAGTETPEHPRATFTSFEESTAEDWALITPQLEITQGFVADRVIGLMRELQFDHGGFPVDRLEHSVQTATRAERDGRDDEYVLCALLHDIGDTLTPYAHPDIAAGILKPFVSEANHFMVKNHGAFQGYYFWHYIGLDKNARDQWKDSPYFDHTEEFCAKYDQTAFDPDYASNPLEHYEPLIRQILRGN